MKRDLDWKTYEEVVRDIYKALGKDKGVSIKCYGTPCKVVGKSGVSHQIDVLTSHTDGIHEYKTAIECKYWNDNVNKDIVMKVSNIIEDAGIEKGVIVTKKGFTEDGIAFARYRNIGLVELREPIDKDWEGRIKDIVIDINVIRPFIDKIKFKAEFEGVELDKSRIPYYVVKSIKGKTSLKDLLDLYAKELYEGTEKTDFQKIFTFDEDSMLADEEKDFEIKVKGLLIGGRYTIDKIQREIKGEDHVWLIMQSVFDKRTMTISPTGEIRVKE